MGLTTDLKASIGDELETALTNVFPMGTQLEDEPALYCLFGLPSKDIGEIDNKDSKRHVLQIDVWYNNANQNMASLDNACDAIEVLFNERTVTETYFFYTGSLITKQDNLPTTDENTHHVQFRFDLTYNVYKEQ